MQKYINDAMTKLQGNLVTMAPDMVHGNNTIK